MPKLIIDTNVLVSATIGHSYPNFIIKAVFSNENLVWCISDEIFLEYQEVLTRSKFYKYPGFALNAEKLLVSIDALATRFTPHIKLNIITDPDDNKFLELAATSNADFLITGNTNHFTLKSYGATKIVTPKEYVEEHYQHSRK